MPKHLVLPQFLANDVLHKKSLNLEGKDALGLPLLGELARKSVYINSPTPNLDITEEAALKALSDGLTELGITGEAQKLYAKNLIEKTVTDPVVLLQPYTQPADFTAQYPQPLDPTEVLEFCEEINVYQALPEVITSFNADNWREMDELDFDATGIAAEGFFLKGGCPDTQAHAGDNKSITRMYIGDQATLSYEDIKHSLAVASMSGLGISAISTDTRIAKVADAKAKEMLLMEILVLNYHDRALIRGNSATNPLAFDGIETQVTAASGARVRANPTGTFNVEEFDQFLAQGCARATHIFGHPMAIRAIKYGYMQLGAASTQGPIMQVLVTKDGNKVVPGYTLADQIDTAIGRVTLIPDWRFTAVQSQPDRFHSTVYPLRVYHNGEPIVYKSSQTPLSFKDLTPGCTAISFMIYSVTALVIKHMCAQAAWQASWPGRVETGCTVVGES